MGLLAESIACSLMIYESPLARSLPAGRKVLGVLEWYSACRCLYS